jgi:acyl-CoA synthetase (NDP forming)
VDVAAGRAIVERALAREECPWLVLDDVHGLLCAYGVAMPRQEVARSPEEAAAAAARIGAPVALKLVSRRILHKTDVGGVRLGVVSPEEAAAAYRAMTAALDARGLGEAMDGALVQPMVSGSVECLIGVVTDPLFGPLIAFGLGGVLAELMGDVTFRIHPLTDRDADDMIGGVKASALLRGYRGSPPADVPALRDLLLRISQLVEDVPEVNEIDINPVMVRAAGQGALALDARIRLARPARQGAALT